MMVERPASVVSQGTSHKYHTVAKTSQVDESLFSSPRSAAASKGRAQNVATFEKSAPQQQQAEVVAVPRSQLSRMLGHSPVLTTAEAQELRKQAAEAKEQERTAAKERKARMLALEEERKKQVRFHVHKAAPLVDTTTPQWTPTCLHNAQQCVAYCACQPRACSNARCVLAHHLQEARKHILLCMPRNLFFWPHHTHCICWIFTVCKLIHQVCK